MRFVRYSSLVSIAMVLALSLVTSCKHTTEPTAPDTTAVHHDTGSCCHGLINFNVKDSSGANVSGASVSLSGEGVTRTETTNGDGHAAMRELCPGTYVIHVTKDGYHTVESHITLTCNDTTEMHLVIGHASTANTDCNAGVISFVVRDSATAAYINGGQAMLFKGNAGQVGATRTIDSGHVSWDGLTPGVYTIRLSKDGYPVKYVTLDSMGCNEHRSADTRWGALHTTDCCQGVLELGVNDASNGNHLQGATVTLSKDNATTATATTTDGGATRFGSLCEGTYHILVTKDGYHGWDTNFTESCNATHGFNVSLVPNTTNTNCYTTSFVLHFADSTHQDMNLSGASVIIYNSTTNSQAASGTTTDGGNFTATGLAGHSTYYVRVSKDGYNLKYVTYQITDCRELHETILVSPH